MISLTYRGSINLCVLCVSVVPSTRSLGGMYLRIHFTHQIQESRFGLQVGGKTGIYLVTKGSTQANIKAAIEWEFNQDKGG